MVALALLSDIHANMPALEAVAAEVRARRPDAVYILGDLVNGCAWPGEVVDYVTAAGWPALMGNHDDAVLQLGTARMEPRYRDSERYGTLWWTLGRLSVSQIRYLENLPGEFRLTFADAPPVRLVHGIPGNFFTGFRTDSPREWVSASLRGVHEPLVAGGHTHFEMVQEWAGHTIVNSGSVGAPYDGNPRASYAWIEGDASGWRAEICRVDYDRGAVFEAFERSGLRADGGALAVMFHRSVATGLPWVSDFAWWLRDQPATSVGSSREALGLYDAFHGPGRWAFPLPGGSGGAAGR